MIKNLKTTIIMVQKVFHSNFIQISKPESLFTV